MCTLRIKVLEEQAEFLASLVAERAGGDSNPFRGMAIVGIGT